MNKFENIRIMLREAQKEINELENIAINFSEEIEELTKDRNRYADIIFKAISYIMEHKTIDETKMLSILRGEQ